jgi:tetratricopeptide (TPR) repeat protein
MSVNTISTEVLINHLRDTLNNPDNKICFILGAGASVESGIESGAMLARKWHNELPNYHSTERIEEWKSMVNFDENNIPAFYSKLFRLRYEGHRDDGTHYITSIIEKGNPGFGYTILSQVLQRTQHNVVITTNFDTLTEESLYIFTDKRALVCNHENLAHLIRPSSSRPLIIKIHRGLYMDPLNDEDETDDMKPQWRKALSDIFHNYIPIVIGYGGNDGSLMKYLKNIDSCQRMYWCLYSQKPPDRQIIEIVEHHQGSFVNTGGFNRLMFRFIDLFSLTRMHDVLEQLAKVRAEKLRNEFEDAGKGIGKTGSEEEKRELGKVASDFDTTDWLQWQLKAETVVDREEKFTIYTKALETLPLSYQLHNSFGFWLNSNGNTEDAINVLKKAIELKPDYFDAWLNIGIAFNNCERKRIGDAITAFLKAIKLKPESEDALYELGKTYVNIEKADAAIDCLQKAVKVKPDYYKAWYLLGVSYNLKHSYYDAIYAFRKAIEIKADYENAWNNMGISFTSEDKHNEAFNCFNKAVEIDPYYHQAWYNLGSNYERRGDIKNARQSYKKAIELNPIDIDYNNAFKRLGKDLK